MAKGLPENPGERGFTLVELLVAMAVGGIVLGAIYSVSISQSRAYAVQEQVVAMQQNLRAGIFFMERDLRMAGYNPTGWDSATADTDSIDNDCDDPPETTDALDELAVGAIGIRSAGATSFRFTKDENGDGRTCHAVDDAGEDVTYSLSGGNLVRSDNNTTATEIIAENVEALDFVYLDGGGDPWSTADISDIRSVQITLVTRTSREERGYSDGTGEVQNLQETTIFTAPTDGFRRRAMSAQVNFRNLGN